MDKETLLTVVTISEAADLWQKNIVSVRRAIGIGRYPLIARRSANVWLITYASCVRRWGEPKKPIQLS